MTETLVVGIDVGGTKIAVLVTTPDGAVLGRATTPPPWPTRTGPPRPSPPSSTSPSRRRRAPRRPGRDRRRRARPRGPRRPAHVTLAVNLGWNDLALRDAAGARLGRPVRHRERRPCRRRRPARPTAWPATADDLAYLAVGTGIAAGVILDGRLHRGARGLAGEIGHAILEPDGPRCACGQRGCLEAFASGPRSRAAPPRRSRRAGRRASPTATSPP